MLRALRTIGGGRIVGMGAWVTLWMIASLGGCASSGAGGGGGAVDVGNDPGGGYKRLNVIYPLKFVSGPAALNVNVIGGELFFDGAKRSEEEFRKYFSKEMPRGHTWEVNVTVIDEQKVDAESLNRAVARILRAADQKMAKESSLVVRIYSQELMHQFWQGTSGRTGRKG